MIAQHRAATAHPNFQSYGPQMDLFNEEQIDWQSYLDNIGRSMGPHGTHLVIPDENSDNTRGTSDSESEGTVMNVPRLGPSGAVLAGNNFNDAPTAHEDTIVDHTPSFQFERHAGPTTRPSGTVLTGDDFDCVPKARNFYSSIGHAAKTMTDNEIYRWFRQRIEGNEGMGGQQQLEVEAEAALVMGMRVLDVWPPSMIVILSQSNKDVLCSVVMQYQVEPELNYRWAGQKRHKIYWA